MQITLSLQAKNAVEAALCGSWDAAININQQILEKDPNNVDAKTRLGRAYIQTRQFDKARKIFKEVLKADPINLVALKNLEIAKKERLETRTNIKINPKAMLMEPGTTKETKVLITAKGITSNDFVSGENVIIKVKKKTAELFKVRKDDQLLVGAIENPEILQALNLATTVMVTFITGKEKEMSVLLRTSNSVFKAEKQDVRPYIKKGGLDEEDIDEEAEEELVEEV